MTDASARRTARGRFVFWTLAGLALLLSHDAIYLAQVGPGQSLAALLRTAGHGYWGVASAALAGAALLSGSATAARILWLRHRAAALGARPARDPGTGRRVLRTWARLAILVAAAFVVQENAEHFLVHGHAPGAGALLGPEYPLALPVISLVTGVAAVVATLVAGRQEALAAAILAALRTMARPARRALRPPAHVITPVASVLARRGAGRAPPWVLASTM